MGIIVLRINYIMILAIVGKCRDGKENRKETQATNKEKF